MRRRLALAVLAFAVGYWLHPFWRLARWAERQRIPIEDRGWVDPYEVDWRG